MYIRKENIKTIQLNVYEFAGNPEKWDTIKKHIQENIKHLKALNENTIKLLFKKKIEYVDLFELQIRYSINNNGYYKFFYYNENTEQLEGSNFLKRIIFYRADSQHKIKEKLLDILFKTGYNIGSDESLIRHYDNMINVITNQKDKLIIGDVIFQLPDELLFDLFVQIVKKHTDLYQIFFHIYDYLEKRIQKENPKYNRITDKIIVKYINENTGANISYDAFRQMKRNYPPKKRLH